jgi:signal transduction histidine kinase
VALVVVVLAVVDVQGLFQTLRSQAAVRDRIVGRVRDATLAARPRLAQLLRPGGAAAWNEGAREAIRSSLAAEFEVFDFTGRRLFATPREAAVDHWPAVADLQRVRSGEVLTLGPGAGRPTRALSYVSFQSDQDLLVLRLATAMPELVEDLRERREILVGHAVSLVVLIVAAGLALYPRGEPPSTPLGALDAYEEAMSRLRERGQALSREHEEERRRLERQMEDKEALARAGELTAGIAHEMRNGLATILGYARLLERSAEAPEAVDAALRIREECETLETVVRRFMDFVKRETLSLAPFDLGRMLSRVVSRESRSGGAQVSLAPATLGTILGDEELLERAFENLVRNAREAAGEGGHVWVAGARDAGAVAVTIADDGPGLPAETRSQVGRPFATTKAGGLGLGLPITLKIVRLHGGDLVLADRAPQGLAATVRLPAEGPAHAAQT